MERKIIHLDMDAYFASVEQRDYPLFKGKPLLVCHTDEVTSNRGVVAAASYEARSFGVKSGISVFEARKKCPQAIYVKGNYDKYFYTSKLIRNICYRFSDSVEIYSADELFMDISSMNLSKAVATAKRLQEVIFKELNLSCSVGLGPNKLVAKMASELNKPRGLSVITLQDWPQTFYCLPIKELIGVGHTMYKHLQSIGVLTIGQLANLKTQYLQKKFGLPGLWLQKAALGMDPTPLVKSGDFTVKSFGHSSALGSGANDMDLLKQVLLALCEGVGFRMRRQRFLAKTVILRLGLKRIFYFTRSSTLTKATDSTRAIYNQAIKALRKEAKFIKSYPCTLIGVSVCNLVPVSIGIQLSFFSEDKDSQVCKAMDKVKNRYGEHSVVRASLINFTQRYKSVSKIDLEKVNRGHSLFCGRWNNKADTGY